LADQQEHTVAVLLLDDSGTDGSLLLPRSSRERGGYTLDAWLSGKPLGTS
jgi:hypothetical protein